MECDNEKECPVPLVNYATSLIRTRSYDEEGRQGVSGFSDEFHLSPINPLHTSFDASQLAPDQPSASALPRFRPAPSWEENDPPVARGEGTLKHAHPKSELKDTKSEYAPPTQRKAPRQSSDNVTLISKTPLRPHTRAKKSTAKQTPASAKRHRAPLHQRRSPRLLQMTPQRSQLLFPPGRSTTPQESDRFTVARPVPSLLLDDDDADDTPYRGLSARRKKKSIGTVTTAASSHALDATTETEDSMDTNDANFRFTSFPASLPRVNTLRTPALGAHSVVHGTVRKRMHFTDSLSEAANRSRDDATHNTSVSSLPVDDGNMYAESDEDAPRSPTGTPVARTRLDFNSVVSPTTGSRRGGMDAPTTPREVKMHFQMNAANCSPIRDIPEEECELSSAKSTSGLSIRNLSQETTSSDNSTKPGRMRPMPDMGAFVENASTPSRERSRERSRDDTASTKSHHSSPRLLCPPTPVRTPAWAHGDSSGSGSIQRNGKMGRFNRQNSLIATKVLAICSPHVLNERNSLENSVLEDGGNGNNINASSLSHSTASADGTGLSFEVDTVIAPQEDSMDDSGDWSPRSSPGEASGQTVTLTSSFEVLSLLGSGTFADVYKVRSKSDGRLYAVKKNRRQFRGKRDREQALAEVRYMQRLQSVVSSADGKSSYSLYLLFFFQAWQEEGHFFCQTELCCRDTCRELLDSLRTDWRVAQTRYPSFRRFPCPPGVSAGSEADSCGRLTPESTIWKMCHDICAGLSHIHSHGLAHFDIKPSNIFFIPHIRFGAMCKIGDFGMAGEIGTSEDGQEGDQKYMAPELLTNEVRHPSADIFSLGLTLYELASHLDFNVPADGPRWHELRNGSDSLGLPPCRSHDLVELIRLMIQPIREKRPTAENIIGLPKVEAAGHMCDEFLRDYIHDIDEYDRREDQRVNVGNQDQTPVIPGRLRVWASPPFGTLPPMAPVFNSPDAA
eukprot:scaffold2512_cov164-Amphora_coffeaeformis.AAC.11